MVDRVSSLPRWVLLLLLWVASAACAFVIGLFSQVDLLPNAGFSAIVGLFVATPVTFSLNTRWRMQDDALGQVPADLRKSVTRAAWSGPVPADPETRAAALRLAERQLQQARRLRPFMYVVVAGLLISTVGNAILDPWKLVFSVLYLPLPVLLLFGPKRLRQRIALLSATQRTAAE